MLKEPKNDLPPQETSDHQWSAEEILSRFLSHHQTTRFQEYIYHFDRNCDRWRWCWLRHVPTSKSVPWVPLLNSLPAKFALDLDLISSYNDVWIASRKYHLWNVPLAVLLSVENGWMVILETCSFYENMIIPRVLRKVIVKRSSFVRGRVFLTSSCQSEEDVVKQACDPLGPQRLQEGVVWRDPAHADVFRLWPVITSFWIFGRGLSLCIVFIDFY